MFSSVMSSNHLMLKFLRSTETALNHVITHVEEAMENRKFTLWAFLDIERAFASALFYIITKAAKWHGLGEGPVYKAQVHQDHQGLNPFANQSINQSISGLGDMISWQIGCMLGGRKITITLAEKLWRGLWLGAVCREAFYHLCCRTWLWMNSIRMAVIHWGMEITLLSSSLENSQTPSQSFSRRLWVWHNSGIIGLSFLLVHKRWQ